MHGQHSIRIQIILAGLLFFFIPFLSAGQGDVNIYTRLMEDGKEYVEKGQYLFAARIFTFIANRSPDSTTQAEALYRFIDTGDRAAKEMSEIYNTRRIIWGPLDRGIARAVWDSLFHPVIQHKIKSLKEVGIRLKEVSYFQRYIVNMDTLTGNYLVREYPDTRWAENILMKRITVEIDYRGTPAHNHPRPVIRKGQAFLERYPESRYRFDVAYILGRAYSDMWNLSEEYGPLLTEGERANIDSLRQLAVKYMTLAYNNRDSLQREYPFRKPDMREIEKLRAGRFTDIFYYFMD